MNDTTNYDPFAGLDGGLSTLYTPASFTTTGSTTPNVTAAPASSPGILGTLGQLFTTGFGAYNTVATTQAQQAQAQSIAQAQLAAAQAKVGTTTQFNSVLPLLLIGGLIIAGAAILLHNRKAA